MHLSHRRPHVVAWIAFCLGGILQGSAGVELENCLVGADERPEAYVSLLQQRSRQSQTAFDEVSDSDDAEQRTFGRRRILRQQTGTKGNGAVLHGASEQAPDSQIGQDDWVLEKLGAKGNKGFYVDVGAHDGKVLSNTWHLDERGWQGLCIDPFLDNFESRTCKLAHIAVAKRAGRAEFIHCQGWRSAISGLDGAPGTENMQDDRTRKFCKKVEVKTKPLAQILNDNQVPSVIDYMSVDVEGAELEVLKTFPFDTHCARLVTVEHTSFHGASSTKHSLRRLLEAQGCSVKSKQFDFFAECPCRDVRASMDLKVWGRGGK